MQPHSRFTVSGRARSMGFAVRGIRAMLATEHNAWIHAAATTVAILLGYVLGLAPLEWCVLIISIVAVWSAEALNTALETLCNVASPEFHPLVERAKDIAAGAVLVSALGATVVGLILFLPRILLRLHLG
ncbi:MAG TPA: diacylglycerol kinase family protein [Gemmatimonadales bacterium]|nr:diacylglycerol kinase family protein [Gemmatimonadales bacterium]